MDWREECAGPFEISGAEIEAGELAGRALPASLRTTYRRGAKHGWECRVVSWRRPALRPDGSIKPRTRDEPRFDPDSGKPLLTERGVQRVSKVEIEGSALMQDTLLLQATTAWEGHVQRLAVVWTDGKFDAAWHRWPHLGPLSSPEVKTFMESGGIPPHRQQGVPTTVWAERAAKAAAKEEDEDGE